MTARSRSRLRMAWVPLEWGNRHCISGLVQGRATRYMGGMKGEKGKGVKSSPPRNAREHWVDQRLRAMRDVSLGPELLTAITEGVPFSVSMTGDDLAKTLREMPGG